MRRFLESLGKIDETYSNQAGDIELVLDRLTESFLADLDPTNIVVVREEDYKMYESYSKGA